MKTTVKENAVRGDAAANRPRRAGAVLALTLTGLLSGLLLAVPAGAAASASGSTAARPIDAASAVGSGAVEEVIATVVAAVLILGAACAVLVYTARHRDSFH